MKQLFSLTTIFFFIAASFKLAAQENGSFTFQIMDYKGSPITKARLIVLSGESHFASYGGVITYFGEEDYVKKNGVMVKTRVMPHYITAKAPGYKDRTIDLTQYALGAYIVVKLEKLEKMSSDYKSISVYVKDKNGKAISGAAVSVHPGKATSTNANGYAEALHTILLSGEYVTIEVYKLGYKIQQQLIPSGDAPRMENGRQIPPATAYFTLEKGDNDATIFHINVEVLDFATDEPIPGASVQLEVSDGSILKGSTNAQGEYRFSDVEYSFAGTTSRVVVKKTGYEEKWSDITSDLMTGKDNAERQFLVYIKKKKETGEDWNGTFKDNNAIYNLSGGNGSVSGNFTYTINDAKGSGSLRSTKMEGNTITGTWTAQHQDDTKTGSRSGTFTFTLKGDTITGNFVEDTPTWNYKPGYSAANVNSSMRKGVVWPASLNRVK